MNFVDLKALDQKYVTTTMSNVEYVIQQLIVMFVCKDLY